MDVRLSDRLSVTKNQSPNLAQRYVVTWRFRIYIYIIRRPSLKVKRSRSKVTKKTTLPLFSKSIKDRFYIHPIWNKGTLWYGAMETIRSKATYIKFGTIIPCGKVLEKMGLHGDLQPRSRSQCQAIGKKATLPCHHIWHNGWSRSTLWQNASEHTLYGNLHPRSY